MRRAAFIVLPEWPTDRLRRRSYESTQPLKAAAPLVLTETVAAMMRITAINGAARAAGLRIGGVLAEARAITPTLAHAPRDIPAERADLDALARWCMRFSPFVAPVHTVFQDAHGLALDICGVAHLFGDEMALLQALLAGLRGLGLHACGAVADTPGLAAALAGFDPRSQAGFVAPPGAGLDVIRHLPVAALRLEPSVLTTLHALGLKRVDDVRQIARASLTRRFGPSLLERLDEAMGTQGEPIDPIAPATRLFALRRLLEPIVTLEAMSRVARDLCASLAVDLDQAGCGARSVRLDLFGVDGRVTSVGVGFARPQAQAARLSRIVLERMERALDGADLGLGVEACLLVVTRLERLEAQAVDLDPQAARKAAAEHAFAALTECLTARLGPQALAVLHPTDSHHPQRGQSRTPSGGPAPLKERPLFLLKRPEPIEALAETPDGPPRSFRWRRLHFRVARAHGPERISDEWWRAQAPTRDYFRIETVEGRRLWLFREGLYGRETDRPGWYVHGSFA